MATKSLNSGMNFVSKGMILFAGNSHRELAQSVADKLGIELGKADIFIQDNKETHVDIKESVRGKDVFILAAGSNDVNNLIMELLILTYACKTSCARSIIGVVPYLPYSTQSQMRKRGSIVSKLLATMLGKSGMTNMITMDLHHKEIQGFYNIPVDNLRASPFLVQYIKENIPDWRNAVIVARNPGAAKRATSYSDRLRLGLAVIHGEQKEDDQENIDGRHSPPPVPPVMIAQPSTAIPTLPFFTQKEKPPINVVGDVTGRIAIVVDDIIDDAGPFIAAGDVLKERGAYKVYIILTHGILSADAPKLLEQSCIDEVIVTNTLPLDIHRLQCNKIGTRDTNLLLDKLPQTSLQTFHVVVTNTLPLDIQRLQCNKIRTVDISLLLAESIRRIHNGESMSYLFRNIPVND